jgi:hypothetical protein
MILGYAARNAISPRVTPQHIAQFQSMVNKEHPTLAPEMPHYHAVGSQVASRIEGLDPDRRRMAHQDLNDNLLAHVSTALKTGKTGPAVQAIRAHLTKLAAQHGVPLPGAAMAQPAPAPAPVQAPIVPGGM